MSEDVEYGEWTDEEWRQYVSDTTLADEDDEEIGERLAAKRGIGERPDADADLDFLTGRRAAPDR